MKACVDTLVKGYTSRIVAEAPSLIQNNEVPSEQVYIKCIYMHVYMSVYTSVYVCIVCIYLSLENFHLELFRCEK